MKIFISGGAKNGKSYYAQKIAKELSLGGNGMDGEEPNPLYYVATMIPSDEEDQARIERHLKERDGWGFTTIEAPYKLSKITNDLGNGKGRVKDLTNRIKGVFLVDSVTAILANNMFDPSRDYVFDENSPDRVAEDLLDFADKVDDVIFVSDYIYADPPKDLYENSKEKNGQTKSSAEMAEGNTEAYTEDYTENYRRGLAYIDRRLAEACDQVIEVSVGVPMKHKGQGMAR